MALLVAALVLVAVALVVFGGRSDDDDAPPADGPTAIAAACVESNAEIATAQRALLAGNEAADAVAGFLADAFVDLVHDRADAIRAAGPGGDVLDLARQLDVVADAIAADPAAAAAATANPFEASNEGWRAAGLAECAIDAATVTDS